MAISELDQKRLWGRAAGRCSRCNLDLTMTLEHGGGSVIGEMAHIVARQQTGPRGSSAIDIDRRNSYENLILLCPNCHTMIDKDPDSFPVDMILSWKMEHEERVARACTGTEVDNTTELFEQVLKLLTENKFIHKQFGPDSKVAHVNPLSDAVDIWELRKVSKIVPNNNLIISMIERNSRLLDADQMRAFVRFREHAVAFERSSYDRLDREAVPRFPVEFERMIRRGVKNVKLQTGAP
jgi:hypothetical protein